MARSQHLRLRELRAVSEWVGEIGELGANATEWRTHALNGLIRLVGGQVAMSVDLAGAVPDGRPMPLDPLDIGWTDAGVRRTYQAYLESAMVNDPGAAALFEKHRTTHFLTAVREQFVDDAEWYASPAVSELRRSGDVDDFVSSTLSWNPGWMQGFIVYRPWGAPRFEPRHRRIMRLCHLGLLRLYRTRLRQNQAGRSIPGLPPRAAQTLDLLLQGRTLKEIASQLTLSVHTVNDYAKVIYQRLNVTSRGELLSKCLSHRPPPRLALPTGMPPPPWPMGDAMID